MVLPPNDHFVIIITGMGRSVKKQNIIVSDGTICVNKFMECLGYFFVLY